MSRAVCGEGGSRDMAALAARTAVAWAATARLAALVAVCWGAEMAVAKG